MENRKIKLREYPEDFLVRYDQFTTDYCNIALEAYYDAIQLYEKMEEAEWCYGPIDHQMPDRMKRKTMVAIVFAAMCAEAFINDYLSVRMGDAEFKKYNNSEYHYYDKIDIIIYDVLKQKDYQGSEWYDGISQLFSKRNDAVHSASKEETAEHLVRSTVYEDWRLKVQENNQLKALREKFPLDKNAKLRSVMGFKDTKDVWDDPRPKVADVTKRRYLEEQLEIVRQGLTALSEMLQKIEELDPKSRAFKSTFSSMSLLWGEDDEVAIREKVFPMIGITLTKESLERELLHN